MDHKKYELRPASSATTVDTGPLFDSLRGLDFQPRALLLRTRLSGASMDAAARYPRPVVTGALLFRLSRRIGDSEKIRFFLLGAEEDVAVDLTGYTDARLDVWGGQLVGYTVVAEVCSEMPDGRIADEKVRLGKVYTPGTYPTPPGAVSCALSVTDAGFRWLTRDPVSAVDIQTPEPPGFLRCVSCPGDRFLIVAASVGISWQIQL